MDLLNGIGHALALAARGMAALTAVVLFALGFLWRSFLKDVPRQDGAPQQRVQRALLVAVTGSEIAGMRDDGSTFGWPKPLPPELARVRSLKGFDIPLSQTLCGVDMNGLERRAHRVPRRVSSCFKTT